MKAISIRAPWWWFILHAGKDIENRDWKHSYRGPVLIHASSWWKERDCWDDATAARGMAGHTEAFKFPSIETFRGDMRRLGGHIVGRADIVGCVRSSDSPWFAGDYGFVLANVQPMPIPWFCSGKLGLFDVPWTADAQVDLPGR